MKANFTKTTQSPLVLLPLMLALAACSGGGSSGSEPIADDFDTSDAGAGGGGSNDDGDLSGSDGGSAPSTVAIDDAAAFSVLQGDFAGIASANPLEFIESRNTPGQQERQLFAGVEVAISDASLEQTDTGVRISANVANLMPNFGMHTVELVVKGGGKQYATRVLSDEDEFLVPGESVAVSVEMASLTGSEDFTVAVFADTTPYVVFQTDESNASPRLRSTGTTRNTNIYVDPADEHIQTYAELQAVMADSRAELIVGLAGAGSLPFDERLVVASGKRRYLRNNDDGGGKTLFYNTSNFYFEIENGATLGLINVHLIGAQYNAIRNSGRLLLDGAVFQGNSATFGAALRNNATGWVRARDTWFRENQAEYSGGAVLNNGTLVLLGETTFSGNVAAKGGAIYNAGVLKDQYGGDAREVYADIRFEINTAFDAGGAIFNDGEMTLKKSRFKSNLASRDTGAGGAIVNASLLDNTLENALFEGNKAGKDGGALVNVANLAISDSQFVGNTAQYGSAIHTCGTASIRHTLVRDNDFPDDSYWFRGAGIFAGSACPTLPETPQPSDTDETDAQPRQTYRQTRSGGGKLLTLEGVTVWRNHGHEGQYGVGVYIAEYGQAKISNSIIAMNSGGNQFYSDLDRDTDDLDVYYELSNNLYGYLDLNRMTPGGGDVYSTEEGAPLDPMLSLDAESGWAIPSFNSPALGMADCTAYKGSEDARGEARQSGDLCDIGAIELTMDEHESVGNRQLLLNPLEPMQAGYNDRLSFPFGEDRMWVSGTVDTAGIVELRARINNKDAVVYDYGKLLNELGEFRFPAFNSVSYEQYALRLIADGLNRLVVEAEYQDGTVIQAEEYFWAFWEPCDVSAPGSLCEGGDRNYTGGVFPDAPEDYQVSYGGQAFSWWDVDNRAPSNFTLTMTYDVFQHYGGDVDWSQELDYFAYRINDRAPVLLTAAELRGIRDAVDGSYTFEIPLENLPAGKNILSFGSLYDSVKMKSYAIHFDVQ